MITSIEVRNINSIKEARLSFEKAKYQFNKEFILNDTVANPIALYGKNGSGKSSLLKSVEVVLSFLNEDPDKLYPFIPNLSEVNGSRESFISIGFQLDSCEYLYEMTADFDGILTEELKVKGKTRLSRKGSLYEYEGKTYELKRSFYPALRDLANRRSYSKSVSEAYSFLSGIAFVGGDRKGYIVRSFAYTPFKDVLVSKSGEVKEILRSYRNFPVYDITSETTKTGEKIYNVNIEMKDRSFTLPFELASEGMKNQSFLLSILLSLPKNGVMIVDELEATLHPLSIMSFITVAREKNVQLVFSSHNTNTLSKLRPDNVVFASWKEGSSTYHRLSDIYPNIREVNNIEKMYLSSTFDEEIEK